ncbi:MAG: 30S ribosomal protein S6 [Syntrophales bacterium]|nr:30S ribosomal protein S6 [Syntrophales bacterium]
MNRYEVVYVAFHDLSTEDFDRQLERYLSIVTDYNGTIVKIDKWGKRKLAYPIQKRREGNYVLIDFVGDSAIIPEMERRLRIDDKILRYLSVKTSDKVDLEEIELEIAAAREAESSVEASESPESSGPAESSESIEPPEQLEAEAAAAGDALSDDVADETHEEVSEEDVEVKEN